MTNTRVNIKGIDPVNIATKSDAEAGISTTKLNTAYSTKQAIDYNIKTSATIGRGLSIKTLQNFSVNDTQIVLPIQVYSFSDYSTTENASQKNKNIATNLTVGTSGGALDTGTISNNTVYYVYAITDSANTNVDCLISLSATLPTMPVNFSKNMRIGTVKTNSIGQISEYKCFTDSISYSDSMKIHTAVYGTPLNPFSEYIIQFDSGISADTSKYRFDSSGNFTASGDVTMYSDIALKENIKPIENALNIVKSITGVKYNKKLETVKKIGFIAQEIEKTIPELVYTHDDGLKSVAYANMTALLVEAIKELSDKLDKLESKS